MAINLYIRLATTFNEFENINQHYKEIYRFHATGSDANARVQNYRLRHFLTAGAPNSTVTPNSGLMVYDGTGIMPLTGSYNDWNTPNRPPRIDNGNKQFDTELIMRFDRDSLFSQLSNNAQVWITTPYSNDNGGFSTLDVESSFSFLGYSNDGVFVKNPMNVVLEHKVGGGSVTRIYTDKNSLPNGGDSGCDPNSNLYKVETVVVQTQGEHGLQVGDAVTLYSRDACHTAYMANWGRRFGKEDGEKYLGDFVVTSVPNSYTFTYQTYHNPMLINRVTHPEDYPCQHTSSDWPDLVWERWELYEYSETVSVDTSGTSPLFIFTSPDPSDLTTPYSRNLVARTNDSEGDRVTFVYNGSDKVHLEVTEVNVYGNSNLIKAVPVVGETFPSGVTSGTLKYTPRLPSADIAYNVANSDIAPKREKAHSKESAIIYACQDTFYVVNGYNVSHGTDNPLQLNRDRIFPILKFPIKQYTGDAVDDPNLVAKMFIYALDNAGVSNNSINLMGFSTDTWDENDTNDAIAGKYIVQSAIGHIADFSYGNPTRTFSNRYIKFNINNSYTIAMLKGNAFKTLYLNALKSTGDRSITFSSRHAVENWPYIAITSSKFIGTTPSIALENTYMYLVCDSIEKTNDTFDAKTVFSAKVSDKVFDSSSLMYVRSWGSSKPFFNPGDTIEVMNTDHYDTISGEVIAVDLATHEVKFTYTGDEPNVNIPEGGIIRNRSRMISTYTASDAENIPNNLHVDGPEVHGKYGYPGDTLEFDVIHDEATANQSSMSVVYDDDGNASNVLNPVLLTDVDLVSGNDHDRAADRFMHVGQNYGVVLKGLNLDKLTGNAYAVLGNPIWENGLFSGGRAVELLSVDGHPEQRKFYYDNSLNLQRSMPIYEVRNEDGVTKFKIHDDDYPYCGPGDIVGAVYTGTYINGGQTSLPSALKYGKNYYVVSANKEGDDLWLTLSSSYIFRYEELTPTYVSLSDDEVAYINQQIGRAFSAGNELPVILYSSITSLTLKDVDFDTTNYSNRLYLQIDEEPPVCYVDEAADAHIAGRPFDVYISDLNDIFRIDDKLLEELDSGMVTYMLGNGDARFIKLTLTLDSDTRIYIYDAAGNSTYLDFTVINPAATLTLNLESIVDNTVDSNKTHTLSFRVDGSDYSVLSNAYEDVSNPGDAGIYKSLALARIENVSEITQDADDAGHFTFDVVIDESTLDQTNGHLEVWVGDSNVGEYHSTASWSEPIIFKEDIQCKLPGDVIEFKGVNLYNKSDSNNLTLMGQGFRLVQSSVSSGTHVSVEVVASNPGTRNLWAKWANTLSSPVVAAYQSSVTVIELPKITIRDKVIRWPEGQAWEEPGDVTTNNGLSYTVDASYLNCNEPGIYTIEYTTEEDSCGYSASDTRTVIVTKCNIPIYLSKGYDDIVATYDQYEDIEIVISPESGVLFNQNLMNNVVYYQLPDSDEWNTATILSGTPDRKRLTIKNPGVIASLIKLKVDVGTDNMSLEPNSNCVETDPVLFTVVSKEEQDKPLDVDGTHSIVRRNSSRSRFDDLNFEPIYNKDLSYSSFSITADENSLMQNVYSILLTNLGERLYDDEFGSTLEESIFEIIGDLNGESKLLNQCVSLINKYEPRVVVVEDKSYISISDDNTVVIVLYIKVPRGIARKIELTFRKDS